MNEHKAREILGCTPDASFKELKSSYRRMIMMIHPDKAGQDLTSQERAKEASAHLNFAWEYLENREKQGLLGKAETQQNSYTESSRGRRTHSHECDVCGFAPAVRISAPMVSSFIYFLRRGKYELSACQDCGIAMSRISLRSSMLKGWWGLGLFFMPNIVFRYFANMNILKKMDPPRYRDPEVVTLSQYPMGRPPSPFTELVPMVASSLAILIVVAVAFGGATESSRPSTPTYYFGQIGSCYKDLQSVEGNKLEMVDCLDADATFRSISVKDFDYLCPTGTRYTTVAKMPDGTEKRACLEDF
jgi:hypothetical protein